MIKKLELKNFKGYEFENFIFEKFNLLTGTNSSGKSTIIQALELFEFTNEDNIRKFPSRKKNEVSIINLTQDKDCHFIGFNELKRRRSLTSISEIDEDNDKFSIEIDGVKKVYDEVSFFDERVKNNLASVEYSELQKKNLFFVHADRFFESNQFESSYYINYIPENNNSTIANYIYDHSLNLQNSIEVKLSEVLREIGLIKDRVHVEKFHNSYNVEVDGGPIEHVGSGIRYTIPIILSVLTNNDSTICIENPELHLHPKAQTKLIEFLVKESSKEKNNNQLIIETHSDHIINAFCVMVKESNISSYDLKTLFIKEQEVTEIPIDTDGKFDLYVKDFFDEYETQLGKLVW